MIITRGYFSSSLISDSTTLIRESYDRTRTFSVDSIRSGSGTTVFISHRHDDIEELSGFMSYLKEEYNVIPYIDSMDKGMPKNTCAETAERIKMVIGN